ncbi:CRISPR-associated protein, Cas1 family [Syntrophus gentianae]|uniref:CRISPR-associated endonuclease Cas1 n=1 Tax=Syntrophus gentianae TaxID=43775 RepID=A0A1H7YIN9_9BACT|nr:CRISPR-associated endonuclease Cas1 [Syntrophus gentianae]SEM46106.1 CRISPR-associated protein, Cas1 family [Syntrophus gentianae]
MVVYVRTQGARIIKEGRHLLVRKGDAVYHTLFTYKLNQLVLFGNVEITHSALAQLMRYGIDTVFLSYTGRYLGRISPPESKNVFLHKRQYGLLDNETFTLRLVRAIVAGKLSNMATLLMRIKRSRNEPLAGLKAREIQNLIRLLDAAESVDSLRGYEGRGSALYFEAFSRGFIENQGFVRRVRRPPTDPVNSVLSLLYTFLMNRVYAAVRVAGLDPYPGFLHSLDYGRYSLVLDLMEEFRTIIADTLALSLFNLKILKRDDFYFEEPIRAEDPIEDPGENIAAVSRDPIGLITNGHGDSELLDLPEQRMADEVPFEDLPTGKYPVKLRDAAFKRVIEAFEQKLTTSFHYQPAERQLTYGEALLFQAGQCRRVIEGEAEVYQPVLLK